MFRRNCLTAFALAIAFVLGLSLSYRPLNAQPAAEAGMGKCVGLTVTTWSSNLRLFRVFEDGTVETTTATKQLNAEAGEEWKKIGK